MVSPRRCQHCGTEYRRTKNRPEGRTFCSKKCWRLAEYEKNSVFEVWRRDKAICHLCGFYCSLEDASRDHIHPRVYGGTWASKNLRLAHKLCNSRRGHKSIEEYKEWWVKVLADRDRKEARAKLKARWKKDQRNHATLSEE